MAEHTLHIHRLRAEYLFSREYEAPEFARGDLDASLAGRLGAECARDLDSLGGPDDSSIWFIPALELEFAIPTSAAPDRLPRAFAARLAQSLAVCLDQPQPETRVFRDRAAYVAAFVGDLLAGRAWDRWIYAEFDGLRSLPEGTAAAEALIREPEMAIPVLRELARTGRLEPLLRILGTGDLTRLVRICAGGDPTPEAANQSPVFEPAGQTGTQSVSQFAASTDDSRANLWHRLLALLQGSISAPDAAMVEPAARLPASGFGKGLPSTNGTPSLGREILSETKATLPPPELREGSGSPAKEDADTDLPADASSGAAWQRTAPPTPASTPESWVLSSRYAGMVLLLRSLVELHLDEAIEGLNVAATGDTDLRAAVRAWVVMGAFGPQFTAALATDPALLTLTGAAAPLPTEAELGRQIDPAAGRALMNRLRGHLIDLGLARGVQIRIDRLDDGPAGESLLLVRDLVSDAWLGAGFSSAEKSVEEVLRELLGEVTTVAGQPPDVIWLARGLEVGAQIGETWRCLDDFAPPGSISAAADEFRAWVRRDLDDPEPAIAQACAAARTLKDPRQEWAELGGGDTSLETSASAAFLLSLRFASRAVLRDVARRLPGFAASSAAFLRANVLSGPLQLVSAPGGWRAEFGPVPLQLLLGMTGLDGTVFRLPWLGSPDRIELTFHGT
jgi:hypothetical protein